MVCLENDGRYPGHLKAAGQRGGSSPRLSDYRVLKASRRVATLIGMTSFTSLETLPGAHLIKQGVSDLDAGRESAEALLVSIGAPRLRSVGIEPSIPIASPEHKLYALLANERGDAAHSAYNALIRRLVSFERAATCAS